jgi:hypothetical protein
MEKEKDSIIKLNTVFGISTEEEFAMKFSTDMDCLQWLARLKWEEGFVCKKCGHTNFCDGSTPFSKRCTRCKHTESATAHTAFHRCKIPLTEAFKLLYQTIEESGESIRAVAKKNDLRNMTCWRLTHKFQSCLQEGDCRKLFGRS